MDFYEGNRYKRPSKEERDSLRMNKVLVHSRGDASLVPVLVPVFGSDSSLVPAIPSVPNSVTVQADVVNLALWKQEALQKEVYHLM